MHFHPAKQFILLTAGINFLNAAEAHSEKQNRDAILRKAGIAARLARSHRGFRVLSLANDLFQAVRQFADICSLKTHDENRSAVRRLVAGGARTPRVIIHTHDLQSSREEQRANFLFLLFEREFFHAMGEILHGIELSSAQSDGDSNRRELRI
jgi:hypothetical protein